MQTTSPAGSSTPTPCSEQPSPSEAAGRPAGADRSRLSQEILTWANLVTALRVVGGVGIFTVAALRHSPAWNLAGLAFYWVLDIADGQVARALKQETRFGAQFDILADRLLVAFFYFNYLSINPKMILPIVLFLIQFMCIDHFLSNQFLRWPVLSPNYFDQIDKKIWRLNWSPLGKIVNTGLVTTLILLTESIWASTVVAIFMIGLKTYSIIRISQLPVPEDLWLKS